MRQCNRIRSRRLGVENLEDRTTPAPLSNFLTTPHVDLNLLFAGGSWDIQPRNDSVVPAVSYDPADALLVVGTNAQEARPASANFDFIGVGAGASYYRLPQSQNPNLLYLGASGYGVAPGVFTAYDASAESKGRVGSFPIEWVKMSLVSVTGPGAFSVWQDDVGGPVVFMSSFNDGVSNPNGSGLDTTDGISADDAIWMLPGGHIHYNFGFTQLGRYEVEFRLSGRQGATTIQSDPIKLYFSVGNVGHFVVDPASYTVNESAGTATVTVKRVGGSDGRITVNYATAGDTATAGSDFTATSGTLTFNDLETTKTITTPIIDDTDEEQDESFTVTLSEPGPESIADYTIGIPGGSLLGSPITATITIPANDVPGPNTPPTITAIGNQTTPEDTPVTVNFTIGDTETPVGSLTVSAVSSNPALVPNLPANLSFSGTGADRTLAITPAENAFGTADITVTVTDAGGLTATRTFTVTVNSVNDPPTILPIDDVVMDEDSVYTVRFTIGDAETPVEDLVVTEFSPTYPLPIPILIEGGGTGPNREIRLLASDHRFGEGEVTITVRDAANSTTSVTFHVTILPVNDPPYAEDDQFFALTNSISTFDLLANDFVVDPGQTFELDSFTQPAHGSLTVRPDGLFTYTPEPDYTGPDSFTYTIIDNDGDLSTAAVTITVGEYMVVDLVHTDIYVNYIDGEWYSNIKADFEPQLQIDSDEAILYANPSTKLPLPELPESFAFIGASEGEDVWLLPEVFELDKLWLGFSNEGTPFETISSSIRLDLAYFSGPGYFSMFDSGAIGDPRVWIDTFDGINTPTDAELGGNSGDFFTLFQHGHAHLNWMFTQPGRYVIGFQPTATVNGVLSTGPTAYYYFDVDALTGLPLTENAPLTRDDAASLLEGSGPVTIDVLDNDSSSPDPLESLTVTAVTQGANGSVAIAPDGLSVIYTPAAGFSGTDSFTYTVTDEHGGTTTATVTLTITAVNDPPTATDDNYGLTPGNVVRGNVLFNDSDAEESTLTAAVATAPAHGSVSLDASGWFAYTPGPTFTGSDTFAYTVSDGEGGTATGTVAITGRPADPGFEAVLSEGHTDVGIAYEEGEWEPHIHDEEHDVEYEPDGALLHVRSDGLTPRPAGSEFDFLGVPVGGSFYRLPQNQNPVLLFLGIGAEEIEAGVFENDELFMRIVAVDGPGHLSLWEDTPTGPVVLAATADGLTDADIITILAGGHAHTNWGFSARGLYAVTVQFFGTLEGSGEFTASEEATYYFAIDPPNVAPTQSLPPTVTTEQNTAFAFTGTNAVSIADADPHSGPFTVTVTATNGTVSVAAAGVTFLVGDGTDDPTITMEGDLAALNAALAGLVFTPAAGFLGSAQITVTTDDGGFLVTENAQTTTDTIAITVEPPTPTPNPEPIALGSGNTAMLRAEDGTILFSTTPFGTNFTGGVRVTSGDVNGDGVIDLIVGAGPGAGPHVKVFDGKTGAELASYFAFEPSFSGGVFVVAADLDGDGQAEWVVTPDQGGGPRVIIFSLVNGAVVVRANFFGIDDVNFRGGARPGLGDLNHDGTPDLVVAAGFLGGPRVSILDGRTLLDGQTPRTLLNDFFVFEDTLRNGVFPALGDADGDGFADLSVGAGPGGAPRVMILSGAVLMSSGITDALANPLANLFAGDSANRSGVRVAAVDVDGDGQAELVSGAADGAARVSVYGLAPGGVTLLDEFGAFDGAGGVFVG